MSARSREQFWNFHIHMHHIQCISVEWNKHGGFLVTCTSEYFYPYFFHILLFQIPDKEYVVMMVFLTERHVELENYWESAQIYI